MKLIRNSNCDQHENVETESERTETSRNRYQAMNKSDGDRKQSLTTVQTTVFITFLGCDLERGTQIESGRVYN